MIETISADGVRLACRKFGNGAPLLLLAGGPGMDAAYMDPVAERLAKHHTVYLPDQRGTGQSGRPPLEPASYALNVYVSDLERLRSQLMIHSWPVVGHSWGGLLALGYTASHPERVESLTLVSTCGPSIEFLGPALERLRSRLTLDDRAAMTAIAQRGATDEAASDNARVSMPVLFHDRKTGERFRDTQTGIISTWGIFSLGMEGIKIAGFNALPFLEEFDKPVLVIHGDFDHIPSRYPKQIAEAAPQGRYVELLNCGHFPWIEAEDQFYDLIGG